MMALRVRELPVGNWLYEMKFDEWVKGIALAVDGGMSH